MGVSTHHLRTTSFSRHVKTTFLSNTDFFLPKQEQPNITYATEIHL